jgi:ATP-dependent DNA helicase RecQ
MVGVPPSFVGMTAPTLDDARAVLNARFGYPAFRAGQERAVTAVLEGRDTLVVLPTGGGKSLCFQVPALLLPNLTVVVSPLISLMKDQVDALTARGLAAAFINSTLTAAQVSDRLVRAGRGELKMLYVAPERFDAGGTADRLRAIGVSLLAVDEAHCISQWGHDFRPSYLRMADVREQLGAPPTIALTATATPDVRRDIVRQLRLRSATTIITGFDRTNLHYHVLPTKNDAEKDAALVETLQAHDGLAVVYASTRRTVERVAGVLTRARIAASAYHAGLDDDQRRDVQDAFMSERVRAIVATNAFGMGIDKPNVRLVVHHAMPGTLEAYYQEAGRAGRDGAHSDCFLLHSFPDRFTHEFFIKSSHPERAVVSAVYAAVRSLADAHGAVSSSTPDRLAPLVKGKVSPREVESAVRVLVGAGALASEEESRGDVHVRLLATPQRIRAELGGDAIYELELLRALWRIAGERLHDGVTIGLDALPPGFLGAAQATAALERLQARQFVMIQRIGGGLRLVDTGKRLDDFSIDWATLDRRRNSDLDKLEMMQRYAYVKSCRRAFVLRYFGDPAAKGECGGCDNCLGIRHDRRKPAQPEKRARTRRVAPSRGTAGRVAQMETSRARANGGAAVGPVADAAPTPESSPLLAALRDMRSTIARADRVPAYVVFADRTLRDIAASQPHTLTALGDVHGIGPAKLDKYGERVLDVVRANAHGHAGNAHG